MPIVGLAIVAAVLFALGRAVAAATPGVGPPTPIPSDAAGRCPPGYVAFRRSGDPGAAVCVRETDVTLFGATTAAADAARWIPGPILPGPPPSPAPPTFPSPPWSPPPPTYPAPIAPPPGWGGPPPWLPGPPPDPTPIPSPPSSGGPAPTVPLPVAPPAPWGGPPPTYPADAAGDRPRGL